MISKQLKKVVASKFEGMKVHIPSGLYYPAIVALSRKLLNGLRGSDIYLPIESRHARKLIREEIQREEMQYARSRITFHFQPASPSVEI